MTAAGTLEVTLPTDNSVQLRRVFNFPRDLVFRAMSEPEHVRQWWGLRSSQMVVCEIDLRVGGKWRYVTREEDGTEVEFYGEYREVTPPERVVQTEIFAPFPDAPSLVTVTLEERDGRTVLTSRAEYPSREVRDMVIATGMETGAAESYDRLEEVLATLS